MKTWRTVLILGLLATSAGAWAQTSGQGSDTSSSGSPDIYNTGKTGSKTLPPADNKNAKVGNANTGNANTGTTENPLKNTLQGIYNRCVAATKKRDESVLAVLRAQDFTYRDAKGKVYGRGDIEATERLTLANAVSIDKVTSQVTDVKADGGKTTATLHHYFAETANDPQNKPHKMALNVTSQEVWTSAANVWKLQSVKVLTQQETIDGKPYDPSAPNSSNNRNNNQNNNRQNGYNGYRAPTYRAPRIRTPKIRTFGGVINP